MGFTQDYQRLGVEQYYKQSACSYVNPHAPIIQSLVQRFCSQHKSVIDLACGGGEVSLVLPSSCSIVGIDPFTSELFTKRTGRQCLQLSFEQIAQCGLPIASDAIICSFAMHLVSPSYLPMLLWHLAQASENLYIISPTKRPTIEHSCWQLKQTLVDQRVHFRHYSRT